MLFKIVIGVLTMALMLAYLVAPLIKLKDISLGIVILLGIAMMAVDLWQSLQSKDE